jgi:hypothetical protein
LRARFLAIHRKRFSGLKVGLRSASAFRQKISGAGGSGLIVRALRKTG